MQPPTATTSLRMINDDEPKRKTLVERAGEPARPNTTFAPGRSVVKGTSLTSARSTSMASSTSSRAQSSSSRNTSASSFASSVGPGPRPQSSYGGRPQTSMSRTRSNTATSKRPATAMDDHLDPGGGPATGKRQGRTQHSHTSSLPSHYGYHQLQYHKTRRAPPQFESHGPSSREVSVSTALSRLRLEDHEAESLLSDATNPYNYSLGLSMGPPGTVPRELRNDSSSNSLVLFGASEKSLSLPKTPSQIPIPSKAEVSSATPATPSRAPIPILSPLKTPFLSKDSNITGFTGWDVRGRIEDMEAMYFELKDTMADTNVERRSLEEAVRHYKIKCKWHSANQESI